MTMILQAMSLGLKKLHNEYTLGVLLLWNIVVFGVFVIVNRFHGLKHYDMPDGEKPTWGKALYMTAITHFAFSPAFTPKDTVGRAIVASHATLSWASLFWTIFSFAQQAPNSILA